MAEFVEVMKQVYCMCNEYKDDGCCKCPLLLKAENG
nr:MAG TPA: Ferredoxin thioredoxin reductase catalytic beta chain [Caudoviricetes sp.]